MHIRKAIRLQDAGLIQEASMGGAKLYGKWKRYGRTPTHTETSKRELISRGSGRVQDYLLTLIVQGMNKA